MNLGLNLTPNPNRNPIGASGLRLRLGLRAEERDTAVRAGRESGAPSTEVEESPCRQTNLR